MRTPLSRTFLLAASLLAAATTLAQDATPPQPSPAAEVAFRPAHLNSGLIMEAMPGTAAADSLLRQYQDSLQAGLLAMEADFNRRFKNLQDSVDYLTPRQSQARQQELQVIQQQVQVYQQEAARMFEVRRARYLQPLVDRVSAAITSYAQANGYSIVFDVAVPNAVLFAEEGEDITQAIIAALGEG